MAEPVVVDMDGARVKVGDTVDSVCGVTVQAAKVAAAAIAKNVVFIAGPFL